MRLTSLADYAVVMMSAAARHCGHAKVNATSLAAETGIPLPTAQKLVSRLSAAGLLESSRGAGGGVRLSRPPATINLADIVEAVEGPIQMTTCLDAERHDCALEGGCQVRPHMGVVNEALRGALASVSLASLTPKPFVSSEVETALRAQARKEPRLRSAGSLDFARDERVKVSRSPEPAR